LNSVIHLGRATALVALLVVACMAPQAVASDSAAQQLADKYVPVVMLKKQAAPCDRSGEAYGPSSVNPILGNAQFSLVRDGATVMTRPAARTTSWRASWAWACRRRMPWPMRT
jgi:hypothetical protein